MRPQDTWGTEYHPDHHGRLARQHREGRLSVEGGSCLGAGDCALVTPFYGDAGVGSAAGRRAGPAPGRSDTFGSPETMNTNRTEAQGPACRPGSAQSWTSFCITAHFLPSRRPARTLRAQLGTPPLSRAPGHGHTPAPPSPQAQKQSDPSISLVFPQLPLWTGRRVH